MLVVKTYPMPCILSFTDPNAASHWPGALSRSSPVACSVPLFLSLFLEHPHDAGVFLQILVMGCDGADITVVPFDCFTRMLLS